MTTHRKQALTVVKPGDKPANPVKPMTLEQAVESGDHFQVKLAQQRAIVKALQTATGPAEASLHRQLSLVSAEVQAIRAQRAQEAAEDLDGGQLDDEAWDEDAI